MQFYIDKAYSAAYAFFGLASKINCKKKKEKVLPPIKYSDKVFNFLQNLFRPSLFNVHTL